MREIATRDILPVELATAKIREQVLAIGSKSLATVEALFATNPAEQNPDATLPWSECSTKTRAALLIYREVAAGQRVDQQGRVALGLVVLKSQLEEKAWEEEAARVDDESNRRTAIEVASVEVKRG